MIIDMKFKKRYNKEELDKIVELIESKLESGDKLEDFSKEAFNVGVTTLRNRLESHKMKINTRRKKVELKENSNQAPKLTIEELELIANLRQDKQVTFRANQETVNYFEEVIDKYFPNASKVKFMNLALYNFAKDLESRAKSEKS